MQELQVVFVNVPKNESEAMIRTRGPGPGATRVHAKPSDVNVAWIV